MPTMAHLFAIVVRLTVVFALAVNGIGVAAYAMHVPSTNALAADVSAPSCHEGADAAASVPATEDGAILEFHSGPL